MDPSRFDTLSCHWSDSTTRRAFGLAAAALGILWRPGVTGAGKKNKKKIELCRDGQTITASKKKAKRHLRSGATRGACTCETDAACESPASPCQYAVCANGHCATLNRSAGSTCADVACAVSTCDANGVCVHNDTCDPGTGCDLVTGVCVETACNDGIDNDGNGYSDGADSNCTA